VDFDKKKELSLKIPAISNAGINKKRRMGKAANGNGT
jgi:hypothetical protein